jgi:hypothetical protein
MLAEKHSIVGAQVKLCHLTSANFLFLLPTNQDTGPGSSGIAKFKMNGATTNGTGAEDDLVASLQKWSADLVENAKTYKDVSGQEGLKLRLKMTDSARQIINAIKQPGETPFEYSVHVWL